MKTICLILCTIFIAAFAVGTYASFYKNANAEEKESMSYCLLYTGFEE